MQATELLADLEAAPRSASLPAPRWDDLGRDVYCVLGIPIDAIDMPTLVRIVERAAAEKAAFLLSTPNLNFLINSKVDPEFRETLILSELCIADGMAVVWMARLMGLPIKERVAGSDMLEALKADNSRSGSLKLFLFGGAEGVVEQAANTLNRSGSRLRCVGSLFPGFGSVEDMSRDDIIEKINASGADFLIAALGAKKGQSWLQRNRDRIQIPIRSHLGAVVNFEAGTVKRAPSGIGKSGFEWLWRIKEEPHLWRRYWEDGKQFLRLLLVHVLPIAVRSKWDQLCGRASKSLQIERTDGRDTITLQLSGAATAANVGQAIDAFRSALASRRKIRINLAKTCAIDGRFLGLILMLRKRAKKEAIDLDFFGASKRLKAVFRLNGAAFLLEEQSS